jgi:hypothetical protein
MVDKRVINNNRIILGRMGNSGEAKSRNLGSTSNS